MFPNSRKSFFFTLLVGQLNDTHKGKGRQAHKVRKWKKRNCAKQKKKQLDLERKSVDLKKDQPLSVPWNALVLASVSLRVTVGRKPVPSNNCSSRKKKASTGSATTANRGRRKGGRR